MHPGLQALAARQGGPFTTAQARQFGYDVAETARLVGSGRWTRLRRGLYVDSDVHAALDEMGRHVALVRGVLLGVREPAVVSHESAAALLGVPMWRPSLRHVHLTRGELLSSRDEGGVRHHAAGLPEEHRVSLDGLTVTSLARTAVDIARSAGFEQGVIVADGALRLGATPEDLLAAMDYCRDWSGARNAGRVVSEARVGSESPGETLLRLRVRALGLPEPVLQGQIFEDGRCFARVDLLFVEQRTVAEFDGRIKYAVPAGASPELAGEVVWNEKRREDRIRRRGYEFERFTWPDLFPGAVIGGRLLGAFARAESRGLTG